MQCFYDLHAFYLLLLFVYPIHAILYFDILRREGSENVFLLFHLLIFVKYMCDTIIGNHLVSILCLY